MKLNIFDKKISWLKAYVADTNDNYFDILNVDFVDSYIEEFNSKHSIQPYGANSCKALGRFLSGAYKRGYLKRGTVSLNRGVGFPNWVYVYSIREEYIR